MERVIYIGSRAYHPVRDGEFDIPFSDLGELRFPDVPYYSTLCVKPLPVEHDFFRIEVSATHAGGPQDEDFSLSVKIFFSVEGGPDNPSANARCYRLKRFVHRVFEPIIQQLGFIAGPDWMPYLYSAGQLVVVEAFYREFKRADNPILASYIGPFLSQFDEHLASFKDTLVFLCHASEDKPFVDRLCSFLDSAEVAV
jgi:hypothetical protein